MLIKAKYQKVKNTTYVGLMQNLHQIFEGTIFSHTKYIVLLYL